MILEEDVPVRMRDGVRISLDINRPDGADKVPAILSMSPYGKETQRFPGGPFSSVESGDTKAYVAHGYAHVLMDSRGSAPSEGQWALSAADEQQDGYEVIEWLAEQPWCNGKVALCGGSYYGQIQFLVAATQPPHLATILPFNGWTDIYRDFIYHGGLLRGFVPSWIANTMARVQPKLNEPRPEGWVGPDDLLADIVVRNPFDGPFYAERDAVDKLDKITVPVYHLVSTASYNHYRGQLLAYTQLTCPQKLMILYGNLRRALYSKAFSQEILRWLDYWTKGIDTGIMREPPVTLLVEGSGEWRFEREYPLARTRWTKMYLHTPPGDSAAVAPWGQLREAEPSDDQPDVFVYPECEPRIAANEPVLGYLTEPFASDVELIGPASLTFYASATTLDAAFMVKIDDVAPDGRITQVSKGWLRASHRELERARSAPGQPYHPHTRAMPLKPGQVEEFEIEIWPLCRSFRAGHRLRLRLASSESRVHDAGDTHAHVDEPMRITVHHSRQYPSHLLLPVIPPDPVPIGERPNIDYLPRGGGD
jgi:predicted acyl esterase